MITKKVIESGDVSGVTMVDAVCHYEKTLKDATAAAAVVILKSCGDDVPDKVRQSLDLKGAISATVDASQKFHKFKSIW